MKTYLVTVNEMSVDDKIKIKFKDFEYKFQEKNGIDARNKAILKLRELKEKYFYGEVKYDCFLETEFKGFKNFNAFSLNLFFIPKDGLKYCLYGEYKEETYEALENEAFHYQNDSSINFDEIENTNEECIQVLTSNLDFFIHKYGYYD